MAKNNPTKTIAIERNWRREISRRTALLKQRIDKAYDQLLVHQIVTNADDDLFNPTAQARASFMNQLTIFVNEYVGQPPPFAWMNKYQQQSYNRGNNSALVMMYPAAIRPQLDLFGDDPAQLPDSELDRRTLTSLYGRAYTSTELWARDLHSRVGIIVESAGITDDTVGEIRDAIDKRVAVNQSRNNVIAQTETIQANQLAETNAVIRENAKLNARIAQMFTDDEIKKLAGGDIGDLFDDAEGLASPFEQQSAKRRLSTFEVAQFEAGGFKLRWISRADSKVRELHRRFHGRVMSPEQAKKNVTISPWNCRCALHAVSTRQTTAKINKRFAAERKQLLEEGAPNE